MTASFEEDVATAKMVFMHTLGKLAALGRPDQGFDQGNKVAAYLDILQANMSGVGYKCKGRCVLCDAGHVDHRDSMKERNFVMDLFCVGNISLLPDVWFALCAVCRHYSPAVWEWGQAHDSDSLITLIMSRSLTGSHVVLTRGDTLAQALQGIQGAVQGLLKLTLFVGSDDTTRRNAASNAAIHVLEVARACLGAVVKMCGQQGRRVVFDTVIGVVRGWPGFRVSDLPSPHQLPRVEAHTVVIRRDVSLAVAATDILNVTGSATDVPVLIRDLAVFGGAPSISVAVAVTWASIMVRNVLRYITCVQRHLKYDMTLEECMLQLRFAMSACLATLCSACVPRDAGVVGSHEPPIRHHPLDDGLDVDDFEQCAVHLLRDVAGAARSLCHAVPALSTEIMYMAAETGFISSLLTAVGMGMDVLQERNGDHCELLKLLVDASSGGFSHIQARAIVAYAQRRIKDAAVVASLVEGARMAGDWSDGRSVWCGAVARAVMARKRLGAKRTRLGL